MPGLLVLDFALYQISTIHHPPWFLLQDYPRPASFMEQKLWASELHARSGLTPALCNLSGMEGLCDHSTELSGDAFLQQNPADIPPGMLLLCKTVPWMDGWSLGSADSYRPLQQHAKSWASTLNELCSKHIWAQLWVFSGRDCWQQLWPTAACPIYIGCICKGPSASRSRNGWHSNDIAVWSVLDSQVSGRAMWERSQCSVLLLKYDEAAALLRRNEMFVLSGKWFQAMARKGFCLKTAWGYHCTSDILEDGGGLVFFQALYYKIADLQLWRTSKWMDFKWSF